MFLHTVCATNSRRICEGVDGSLTNRPIILIELKVLEKDGRLEVANTLDAGLHPQSRAEVSGPQGHCLSVSSPYSMKLLAQYRVFN